MLDSAVHVILQTYPQHIKPFHSPPTRKTHRPAQPPSFRAPNRAQRASRSANNSHPDFSPRGVLAPQVLHTQVNTILYTLKVLINFN